MTALLLRPHTTVVAGVRDTASPTSHSLELLPKASESRLVIVKIDSSSVSDAKSAISDLGTSHGVLHLDVVLANAAVTSSMTCALNTIPEQMKNTFEVNSVAPLLLFQAAWPLLQRSQNPKFIALSSDMGSISHIVEAPGLAYGMSKAALNHLVKTIHIEHGNVTAVALHPGYDPFYSFSKLNKPRSPNASRWVQTDMGYYSAKTWGVEKPPTPLDDSIEGCLKQVSSRPRSRKSSSRTNATLCRLTM